MKKENIFLCEACPVYNTQSKAGQRMDKEYLDNRLNGLITNKYKYKNTMIIFFIIKKKVHKRDTKGT